MTTQSFPIQLSSTDITVTKSAQAALAKLIEDADDEYQAIRVYVQGGGCDGMGYSMTFAEDQMETDSYLDCNSFKLVMDPVAFNFLQGCEIDFVEEGLNTSFIFRDAFQSIGGSGACSGCGAGAH